MSNENTVEAVIQSEETVENNTAPVKKARATKKVAEKAPVKNVAVEEVKSEDIVDDQKVITGPAKAKAPRNSNTKTKENGVIASNAADVLLEKKVNTENSEVNDSGKIAVWSEKNIRWQSVGSLVSGYNIITKEEAEKWLSRANVRVATPEEVATYYGK
jgi:hypothetical protein